ncbi:PIR protein [Plasmodium vivax]|uniref:VIR protein n=1 Tax=Plasmodium vivax TaxID=5855 RepID=A0A565A4Y6_PLAVI|nr:PIR protein [Plasmodium vivax]
MAKPTKAELENSLKNLKLNSMYDDFFSKESKSEFEKDCDVFISGPKKNDEAKKLCHKLVYFLEKIGKTSKRTEANNYCDYLPYWLYDQIGGIEKDHTNKIGNITFAEDLINIGNTVRRKIKQNYCYNTIKYEKNINLDEMKNRKVSYIYFKNYDKIKSNISSRTNDKCKEYSVYLDNINSLYNLYKKECKNGLFGVFGPDHADCRSKYDPKALITALGQCKDKGSSRSGSGGDSSIFELLFGGPTRPSQDRNSAGVQPPTRVAGATNSATLGSPRDKVRATEGPGTNKALADTVTLQSRANLSDPKRVVPVVQPHNSQTGAHMPDGSNDIQSLDSTTLQTTPEVITDTSNFLEKTFAVLKSEYFRHSIVGASIIGVVVFLYFFFRSTPMISRSNKRGKKKRESENNYYEEYEAELSNYGSQESFAESQMSDVYLSYQPRRDSYY